MGRYGAHGLVWEDFVASRPLKLLKDERDAGVGCAWDDAWAVAPGYELRGPDGEPAADLDDALGLYLAAEPPLSWEEWAWWKGYLSLRDKPDLFLRLARLAEGDTSPDKVVGWTNRYGLLGCGEPAQHPVTEMNARWFGRPEDSIGSFVDEAERAATVLAWIDALTSGDADTMLPGAR